VVNRRRIAAASIILAVPPDSRDLITRPEDRLYRTIYAPVDLSDMLASAESRSTIRRLPAVQLYFGMKELSDEEIGQLVPHVTTEQWQGILDLDLWSRDRASVKAFINLQRHLLLAADPVARKLVAAADPELWELTFNRLLKIHPIIEDDVESEPEEGEIFTTPDQQYLLILPRNADLARVLRALLSRLYGLDADWTRLRLESARFRTQVELLETAYQNRTQRAEEMGFPDYYQAIEIYGAFLPEEQLPQKRPPLTDISTLPAPVQLTEPGGLLIMQVLASLSQTEEIEPLLEELFSVCNHLLTADRVSPARARLVRLGIRKALSGISLGLDLWSEGKADQAVAGVQQHYLQSFFRLGHTKLLALRRRARRLLEQVPFEAGSYERKWLEELARKYPIELLRGAENERRRRRFFSRREDVEGAEEQLRKLEENLADDQRS
jgi:hypothetical protein